LEQREGSRAVAQGGRRRAGGPAVLRRVPAADEELRRLDAPPELVTADAPRRFRPFAYMDYLRFKHTAGNGNGDDVLDRFAGM
jgi:hypothetical protein